MRHLFLLLILLLSGSLFARAGEPSQVSPYYFGPNAFPIPDILVATEPDLRVEVAADWFSGHRGDNTYDIFFKVNIPLWTPRANLSLWMPAMEWYSNSQQNLDESKIDPEDIEAARCGSLSGDLYVSADMQLLTEGKMRPGWTLRAALKTASGGSFRKARYYDSAGYFFDTALSKSIRLGNTGMTGGAAISTGFLCWQTGHNSQNDAVMYGVRLWLRAGALKVSETFGGYIGWESGKYTEGPLAHDCPMSLKTDVSYRIKQWEILACVQYGLKDYPYTQLRLGAAWHFDLLHRLKK